MFTGEIVTTPVGTGGLNSNQSTSQLEPDDLIQAQNVTYQYGTLQKEGGSVLYTPSALSGAPIIYGGTDWWPTLVLQRSVIWAGTKLLRDTGAGTYVTTLRSGFNAPTTVQMFTGGKEQAAANRHLFIYSGTNQVQFIDGDGTTCADITSPPADWSSVFPLGGCIHLNRHWGFGGVNPHWIYGSDPADHTNFTNDNAVNMPVYPGDGDHIAAIASFKGMLIVWKYPRGIFFVNMQAALVTSWFTTPLSKEIGIAGPNAWAYLDDDILFMDPNGGIHLLSAVLEFGDYGLRSVSDIKYNRNWIINNVDLSKIPLVQCISYLAKRECHFTLAAISNGFVRDVVDVNRTDLLRFRYSDKDSLYSMWLRRDSSGINRPAGGDSVGQVWTLDSDIKSVNGVGYPSVFQTPHLDFSFVSPSLVNSANIGAHRKNFKFIELVIEPSGNWLLELDIYIDGAYTQTLQFNMGSTGAALGSFTLNTNVLGAASVLSLKKRCVGSGKRISVVGNVGGANQDYSISEIIYYFTVSQESTSA